MTSPGPAPILQLTGITHAYGGRPALRGVDLSLNSGEIYALLGPNGAGKSTLVRALCGRIKPDGGEVRLAGEDPWRVASARKALGLVPQEIALYAHLTVRENLETFARLSGLKGGAVFAAVDESARLTRVADRCHVPVKHLSGGYQRRVNIAAAILHKPALLILDEPTVGVDIHAREAVDQVIRALRDNGVAILVVTHDLEQAGALADRVGFLREGMMVREGAPAALLEAAFGHRMEVLVLLGQEPDEATRLRLAGEGLSKAEAAGVWSCLAEDGYAAAGRLDAALKAAGLAVREVRVRQPSLANLFSLSSEPA